MKKSLLLLLFCFTLLGQNRKADSLFYAAGTRLIGFSQQTISDEDLEYCIRNYSEAIKLNPKFWKAYRNRARLYFKKGEYQHAISDLSNALKYCDEKSSTEIRSLRGHSYYAQEKFKNAIEDFTYVISKKEKPVEEYYRRALSRKKIGLKEKACQDYRKALLLNPGFKSLNDFPECPSGTNP